MKVTVSIGEDRKFIIPDEFLHSLPLEPGKSFELEVREISDLGSAVFDKERFDATMRKFAGSKRERLLADGYTSVDDLLTELRPPW